jgi:hypothetical protein
MMLETLYFTLGVANNVALIIIFVLRGRRMDLVRRVGWLYFLLAIPAIWAIVVAQQDAELPQYTVFLALFLAFLGIEVLYDWILRIPFRESMDWRLLVPYVALYIASNYGFVVMVWRYDSTARGMLMLALLVIQLAANLTTHPRGSRPGAQ